MWRAQAMPEDFSGSLAHQHKRRVARFVRRSHVGPVAQPIDVEMPVTVYAVTKRLVIDDEERFVRALAISLRARGYEVETAATGEAGLELAARAHPDVIVLDLGLPGID